MSYFLRGTKQACAFFFVLLNLYLFQPVFSEEVSPDIKEIFKKRFVNIAFKIDNSFVVNNKDIYLPLIPQTHRSANKIKIVNSVQDTLSKNSPKLIELSNGWMFVKLIKQKDGNQTIIDLKEIPESIKTTFLDLRFPGDLVIPKGFVLKEESFALAGSLPIKIEWNLNGLLYLTSPDTGKIVYLDLSDVSMIYSVQTKGTPWDIVFDKENKIFYVSDFAKDLIYTLKPLESSILTTITLPAMSSPTDIELSGDGSLIYILESLANNFAVYKTKEPKLLFTTKTLISPASFTLVKDLALITISSPSSNSIIFLNANSFLPVNQIMLEGNPEKIIYNPVNNLLYIANRNGNSISVIDPVNKKTKDTIQVGETPVAIAIDSSGKWLYVANAKSNTISIIDTENESLAETIPLPVETQFPGDIKITSDNRRLIVTSETTNVISIIDLNLKQVVVKLDVGATTHAAFLHNAK